MPKSRRRKKKSYAAQITARTREIVERHKEAFRHKFGREIGPGDPLFFDPDKDVPTPIDPKRMEDETVAALRKAGVAPQIIFAYKRTGRLLMKDNLANYPPEARAEWKAAIDEYFRLEEQASGDAPKEEGRPGADMRTSPTQIPELLSRPLTPEEHELITRCLQAIDEILSDAVTLALRVELAAVMLATVRSAAFDSVTETDGEEEVDQRCDFFEHLTVLRSREIYEVSRGSP
jgi:hypothetical protein